MLVRVEGHTLPGRSCAPAGGEPEGYANVHVGVQRRTEVVELVPGDAEEAVWSFEVTTRAVEDDGGLGIDVGGPYAQGPKGDRFFYLSWGTVDGEGRFTMFRRAKLLVADIPPDLLRQAATGTGTLVARLGLTDPSGNPICARVRPPAITWSAT